MFCQKTNKKKLSVLAWFLLISGGLKAARGISQEDLKCHLRGKGSLRLPLVPESDMPLRLQAVLV